MPPAASTFSPEWGDRFLALKGPDNKAEGKAQAAALGHDAPHPSSVCRSPEGATESRSCIREWIATGQPLPQKDGNKAHKTDN
jgi:hypothetical protein